MSLTAEVTWDNYEFDKLKSLPNVKVWFNPPSKPDQLPTIAKITIQFRETLEPSKKYSELKVYTPSTVNFDEGLRMANCAFFIYGESAFHLALGHVYGAQVAAAAHDYLQGTKIGELLLPHCDFIRKITFELGKSAIFGDSGILNESALSTSGVAHLISDTLASIDPFTFQPRRPISENHYFAKAEQLHYDILKESVTEFINNNWSEIEKEWEPLHQFFYELFKKSPLYRPWEGSDLPSEKWQDTNEIGGQPNPTAPERAKHKPSDQKVKSFRPIAKNPSGPNPCDKEMIIKFATHFIFLVTLWHSWIHRSQYAENSLAPHVMDVNFSPVALSNYGKDRAGGISVPSAIAQAKLGQAFKGFKVEHYALVNSNKVYRGLVERIQQAREKYLAVGIDPNKEIAYSTVI